MNILIFLLFIWFATSPEVMAIFFSSLYIEHGAKTSTRLVFYTSTWDGKQLECHNHTTTEFIVDNLLPGTSHPYLFLTLMKLCFGHKHGTT